MKELSDEWIAQYHEESREYYLRNDIIHLPSKVSNIDISFHRKAGDYNKDKIVPARGKASTKRCEDCRNMAENWHHNVSYEYHDLDKVIPLCVGCHVSLHNKLDTGIYYRYGLTISIRNFLVKYPDLSVDCLAHIHGVSQGGIRSICSRNSIKTNFMLHTKYGEKSYLRPNDYELEILYEKYVTSRKVAEIVGVSKVTIIKWLRDAEIPIKNGAPPSIKTSEKVELIKQLRKEGMSLTHISYKFNVSRRTISNWLSIDIMEQRQKARLPVSTLKKLTQEQIAKAKLLRC